jgi:anti-sigma factor RsiW
VTNDERMDDADLMRLRHGEADQKVRLEAMAATDPGLGADIEEWDRQDAALRALYDPVGKEQVPPRHTAVLMRAEVARRIWLPPMPRIAAAVALLTIGAMGGWLGTLLIMSAGQGAVLSTEAFRAFSTYATEVAHPVEVSASDRTQLAAWLSGRIGRRIAVPDLSSRGFHLMGGRVLPAAEGNAALAMYQNDAGQRLIFYVAREPGRTESTFRFVRHDAMQGYWWYDEGLGCALIGTVPRDTLHSVAIDAYEQVTAA